MRFSRLRIIVFGLLAISGIISLAVARPVFAVEPADPLFQQALLAIEKNDYNTAITRLDDAIRQSPKDAKPLGFRGMAWLRKGEYARGLTDLKAAIQLNPGDAGRNYKPSSAKPLPADALRHGQEQVAAMLRDRPAMADFGREADFLRDWAARKFAGEDFGSPIDWDPSPPLHSDAEHLAPSHGDNAAILVASHYDSGPNVGKPRSFEELWAGAVYELHNVTFAREFVRLHDEAERGKVSKRDFVAGILKYELQAAQQTRAFYVQVFLPWAAPKKLPTDPTLWFCDWWDSPDKALQTFANKSAYPWRPYARAHDWATVQYYWRHGNVRKALKLLRQMKTEKGYEEDEGDLRYWIGRCHEALDSQSDGDGESTEK